MLGLDRELVEHQLVVEEEFRPFKQPFRRMAPEIMLKVKEVERLLKAGFIRPITYAKWLSNIVPVVKKNKNIWVCIDLRNINLATLKDEYPMSMTNLLIDRTTRHGILSFMDDHSGYNQIYVAEEDTHKTAFRCLGARGTYAKKVIAV